MKILCFGDSNVYGFNPTDGTRYNTQTRWSGILKHTLAHNVIEAGCNNRTAFQINPFGDEYTGSKILPKYLDDSFDIIILAIGINDTQKIYNTSPQDIKIGIKNLIAQAKEICPNIKIILLSPSIIGEDVLANSIFFKLFDKNSIELSKCFARIYKSVSEELDCEFLDLDDIVSPSKIDGLHYTKESHQIIANKLCEIL